MYEEFYRFGRPPFTLAPDPRFLYRSESHTEALAELLQAIRRREGFIVLTGDIGTGKTTICRALLQQLDAHAFTSLILNPFVSVEELLREMLLDFGVVSREAVRSERMAGASKHELISALQEFLLSLIAIRGSGVLIIDEAQHLSPEVLEQIRIMSNLETNEAKLLQIVLVGQLNLLDVLKSAQMRQLDQRISLRAKLKPLARDEVEAYVAHRLWVAGPAESLIFEAQAVDAVHAVSGGVPRVINLVCDRALMLGAEQRVSAVTPALIDQAAQKLALKAPTAVPVAQAPRVRTAAPALVTAFLRMPRVQRWTLATVTALVLGTALMLLGQLVDATPPPLPSPPAMRLRAPLAPIPPGNAVISAPPAPIRRETANVLP